MTCPTVCDELAIINAQVEDLQQQIIFVTTGIQTLVEGQAKRQHQVNASFCKESTTGILGSKPNVVHPTTRAQENHKGATPPLSNFGYFEDP